MKQLRMLPSVVVLAALLLLAGTTLAFAQAVEPTPVAADSTCQSLGYDFGITIDIPAISSAAVDQEPDIVAIVLNLDAPEGQNFGFVSTLPVAGAIVRGGPGDANHYDYPGGTLQDSGLHALTDAGTGLWYNLSTVDFCFNEPPPPPPSPLVSKTAETSFARDYTWTITKTAELTGTRDSDWAAAAEADRRCRDDAEAARGGKGCDPRCDDDAAAAHRGGDHCDDECEDANAAIADRGRKDCDDDDDPEGRAGVQYTITVNATPTVSSYAVSGTVTLTNPDPAAEALFVLSDTIGATQVPLTCDGAEVGYGGSVTLPAGVQTLTCTYSTTLPTGDDAQNVLTATINGSIVATATAPIRFGPPSPETDECITVTDDMGTPGDPSDDLTREVCADDGLPHQITYGMRFGDDGLTCADLPITNTAGFVTNDNGETGSASFTLEGGNLCACTRNQDYWRENPDDPAWAALGSEADDFFGTGVNWLTVLQTPLQNRNVYLVLAHQYIAARLNIASGLDAPQSVDHALAWAESFFAQNTPTSEIPRHVRGQALWIADLLDRFNEGRLDGFGPCGDDDHNDDQSANYTGLYRFFGEGHVVMLPIVTQR